MPTLASITRALAERAFRPRYPDQTLLPLTAGLVLLAGYLAIAGLIAFAMAAAGDSRLSLPTVLVTALPSWLAAHQVPLWLMGSPLGALPLLPTVLIMLLIGMASARLTRRSPACSPRHGVRVICWMGLAHAVSGTVIAQLLEGVVAAPATAFVACGATATVAATVGVVDRCGMSSLVRQRLPEDMWCGLRAGLYALAGVFVTGALVVLVGVGFSVPAMYALSGQVETADQVGAVLVSALYLPNAVLGGWSFAVGTGFSVGRLPSESLAMLMPESFMGSAHGATSWVAGLGPLAVSVFIGWSCRRAHGTPWRRLGAVALASVVTVLGTAVFAVIAGGRLGDGFFDPVSFRPVALALAMLSWFVPLGMVLAWFAGPPRSRSDNLTKTHRDDDQGEGDRDEVVEGSNAAVEG